MMRKYKDNTHFQMPSIPSIILHSENMDLEVSPSLSDVGLCTTLNGNQIKDTFDDRSNKMTQLKEMLGSNSKSSFKPMTISGSGKIHHKKMWLNVRDVTELRDARGIMSVAINDWKDYISVRYIELKCCKS
jgi:hypothetical protein